MFPNSTDEDILLSGHNIEVQFKHIKALILQDKADEITTAYPGFVLDTQLVLRTICTTVIYNKRDQFDTLITLMHHYLSEREMNFFSSLWDVSIADLEEVVMLEFDESEYFIEAEIKSAFTYACTHPDMALLQKFVTHWDCLTARDIENAITNAIINDKKEVLKSLKNIGTATKEHDCARQFFFELLIGDAQSAIQSIKEDREKQKMVLDNIPSFILYSLPTLLKQGRFPHEIPGAPTILSEALAYYADLDESGDCQTLLSFGASVDFKEYAAIRATIRNRSIELFSCFMKQIPKENNFDIEKLHIESLRSSISCANDESFLQFAKLIQGANIIKNRGNHLLELAEKKWRSNLNVNPKNAFKLAIICEFLKPKGHAVDYKAETLIYLVSKGETQYCETLLKSKITTSQYNLIALKLAISNRNFQIIKLFAKNAGFSFLLTYKEQILKHAFDLWIKALTDGEHAIEARRMYDFLWSGHALRQQEWWDEALRQSVQNQNIILASTLVREYGAKPTDAATTSFCKHITPSKIINISLQGLYTQKILKAVTAVKKGNLKYVVRHIQFITTDQQALAECLKYAMLSDQEEVVKFLFSYPFAIANLEQDALHELIFIALLVHNKKYYLNLRSAFPYNTILKSTTPEQEIPERAAAIYGQAGLKILAKSIGYAIRVSPLERALGLTKLLFKTTSTPNIPMLVDNLILSGKTALVETLLSSAHITKNPQLYNSSLFEYLITDSITPPVAQILLQQSWALPQLQTLDTLSTVQAIKSGNFHLLPAKFVKDEEYIAVFKSSVEHVIGGFNALRSNLCTREKTDLRSLLCTAKPETLLSFGGRMSFDIGAYILRFIKANAIHVPKAFYLTHQPTPLSTECKNYIAVQIQSTKNIVDIDVIFDRARSTL